MNQSSKKADTRTSKSKEESLRPLSRRRLWLFRLAALFFAPAFLFIVLEIVLRLSGYGYNPDFFLNREIGGRPFYIQSEHFSRRFFPPETMRQPNALRMRAEKPPGSIRIFVLGESAAMGDPEPAFGPSRYLDVLLQQRFPGRDFEIVNVAFTAINSHVLLPLATECAKHDGDAWIIYMGNNEMVGPYGAATILGSQAPPRFVVRLVTMLQRTRVGQLGVAVTRKLQKPSTQSGSWGGMAMFQKQRVPPKSPKREAVYENFAANLEEMLHHGLDSGAGIILNSVAVNLHDSPPFASVMDEKLPDQKRKAFDDLFQKAVKTQSAGDLTNAAGLFNQALAIDDGFAEAHYRLAMCLEQVGQAESARKHFQLACDTDALPFRTDTRENGLIREAASRHAKERLVFVDAPVLLAANQDSGIPGQESFYEHVHFNFAGSYRLGLAWAQAVDRILPELARSVTTNDWALQYACDRRLGLSDWNRILVTRSVIQRLLAPPLNGQFNNADRLNRLSTYERFLLSLGSQRSVGEAREMFAEAVRLGPNDHHVREAHAVFQQASGDLEGAILEWQQVGELLPHDFLPWFEIGSLRAKQGNFAESEKFLNKALGLRPALVEGWNELGQCLGAQQKWPPALAAFERASQLRPDEPTFWAFRAKTLGSLQRSTEAMDCYRKAVTLNPAYAEAYAALGDLYSQAGKIQEAITEYESAIRSKPEYAVAHLNLGIMLSRQGRFDDAITEFRRTLSLEPGNPVAQDCWKQVQARKLQSR